MRRSRTVKDEQGARTQLPAYVRSAIPNPPGNRAAWYKNTAPAYAGIFLWFVFWQGATTTQPGFLGGTLAQGVGVALLGLFISALVCHFLFYLGPGTLGMKSGLPLYIVGTSIFGVTGGFLLPGFLMGVLQFAALGVNDYFSSVALAAALPLDRRLIMVVYGLLAAFVGLKGIHHVAKVATFLPLIPLFTLLWLFAKTSGHLHGFDTNAFIAQHKALAPAAPSALNVGGVIATVLTYVVGFFSTAGAAGTDLGLNSRDSRDVNLGGLIGVALAILVTAGLSVLIVAGAYGSKEMAAAAVRVGTERKSFLLDSFNLIPIVLGPSAGRWVMFLLVIAAFPSACFSSFIAANSFKTTLPQVNPSVSVGIGAAVSIASAISGYAAQVVRLFVFFGASFGPICGAMTVDYLLAGKIWSGPRAGFNPAGWMAWAVGFVLGILPNLHGWKPEVFPDAPAAPLLAYVVGAIVYFVCVKAGLTSATVPLALPWKAESCPGTRTPNVKGGGTWG